MEIREIGLSWPDLVHKYPRMVSWEFVAIVSVNNEGRQRVCGDWTTFEGCPVCDLLSFTVYPQEMEGESVGIVSVNAGGRSHEGRHLRGVYDLLTTLEGGLWPAHIH